VLFLAVFIGGCSNVQFNPAPGAPSYGAYKGEVKLLDRLPPPGRYTRIGIVIARGPRATGPEDLIEDIKTEAAKRGADAIVQVVGMCAALAAIADNGNGFALEGFEAGVFFKIHRHGAITPGLLVRSHC
jgi:hypothetical protein